MTGCSMVVPAPWTSAISVTTHMVQSWLPPAATPRDYHQQASTLPLMRQHAYRRHHHQQWRELTPHNDFISNYHSKLESYLW